MHTLTWLIGAAAVAGLAVTAEAQDINPDIVLVPDEIQPGDELGYAVSIDDGVIAVGARQFDFGGFPLPEGEVYLFDTQTGRTILNIPSPDADGDNARFGSAVEFRDGILVVGAPLFGRPGFGIDNAGAVFVFDASTGELLSSIIPDGIRAQERVGLDRTIALSEDNILAIGVPLRGLGDTGSVFLYDLSDPASPTLITEIDQDSASGLGDVRSFGSSVDFGEDGLLAIGAEEDDTFELDAGAAFVFDVSVPASPAQLTKVFAFLPLESDQFGNSIALEGGVLVVGADQDGFSGSEGGFITIFDVADPADPRFLTTLLPTSVAPGDQFSKDLALRDSLLVVGAPFADSDNAYVFDIADPSNPQQVATLVSDVDQSWFGFSVDIGSDVIGVGAPKTAGEGRALLYASPLPDCPADLDGDGELTLFDFLEFQSLFDAGDPIADFDGDGELTLFDFLAFQTAFDAGCE